MKKTFLIFVATLVLAGCGHQSAEQKNVAQSQKEPTAQNKGYVDTLVNTQKTAQDNVEDAVAQKNNQLNNALDVLDEQNTMEEEKMTQIDDTLAQTCTGAKLMTNKGVIEIAFYNNDAPLTVANFCTLAGKGFYDGVIFHRIIKDFMVQGGDPEGTGRGGPGYTFKDEINDRKIVRGSLAMANAGPNTNGSQFFIVTAPATPDLDGLHTNFGEIVSSMDVVDAIEAAQTDPADKPLEDIVIENVELTLK